MFIPYMLLVFQTILKSAQHIDADRVDAYIQAAQKSIQAAQEELEGRFARSLTMLGNSRNDLSTHLSKVNSSLTAMQISTVAAPSPQPLLMLEGQAAS
jgi:DNA recombination protein RmuC